MLILLILIGSQNFENVYAQDGSKAEIRKDIFSSGEVIGNEGIETYLISHQIMLFLLTGKLWNCLAIKAPQIVGIW